MSGRVAGQLALVVAGGDDLAGAQHDGADRDVAVVEGAPSLGDGHAHGGVVVHEGSMPPFLGRFGAIRDR